MKRRFSTMDVIPLSALLLGIAADTAAAMPGAAPEATLIPRAVLFGSPDKAGPQLSPDGMRLAFLAPVDGVLNVWIGPAEDPGAAKPVTHDKGSGVLQYFWAYDGKHVLYLKDRDGDENHHLYRIDLAGGSIADLTPYDGAKVEVLNVSSRRPGEVLVGINNREKSVHDPHIIEIATGKDTLVEENPGYLGYVADDDYRLRFAIAPVADGSLDIMRRGEDGAWSVMSHIGTEDNMTTGPIGVDADGRILYMTDSRGRNTSAVTATDLATGTTTVVAEDARADADNVFTEPRTGRVRAVAFNYDRRHWTVVDPAIRGDLDHLATVADGEVQILSTSLDDRRWIAGFMMDTGPYRYYLYDRPTKSARLLFTNRKALEKYTLAKMHSPVVKTRDGLDMVCYLTVPVGSDANGDGIPDHPLPMVLMPHGGPWYRDNWGLHPWHQFAANRGYAVLMPQFRGSTGFGKAYINASNMEWGGAMHDDLLDAVAWAVKSGIADPKRIAIMGGSYGGYATLWGLTNSPDTFACGVDIFGVSNLITMLESFPAYWGPAMELMYRRIGDTRTEEGRAFLASRSPLTHVDRITKPLLIVHGANDVRVTLAESDQLVRAMKARKIPVTYCVFPDEGHLTFFHPQNNIASYAVTEQFLKQHLGGRAEPIGDALEKSSIEVREGDGEVPGLEQALVKTRGHREG